MNRTLTILLLLILPPLFWKGGGEEVFGQGALPKAEADSLWAVWNNPKEADTNRLKAINRIAINGYLYTEPDSSFYYAQLQYDFAQSKGLKKQMANAWNLQGATWDIRGDFNQALDYYQRSLKIREETADKNGIAGSLGNIGGIYWNHGNYHLALDYYQRSLMIQKEIGDRSGMANSLNNIGLIYQYQADYLLALDHYQRSLELYEKILQPDGQAGDKRGIARTLGNIGMVYQSQGNYPQALEHYQRSLKIGEEIGDKNSIASSMINIGNIYSNQGDYSQALDYFQHSLMIREKIGNKNGIASSLGNIGGVYMKQGDYPQALDYYQRSLKIQEEIENKVGVGNSLGSIGNIYSEQGDYLQALDYYQRSLKIQEEIGDKSGIAKAMGNIGILYNSRKDHRTALLWCEKGQRISEEIGALSYQKDACKCLYEAFKALGMDSKALRSYEQMIFLRDSLFNEENTKKITQMDMQYAFDKKEALTQAEQEKKDAIATEELRRKNQQRNAFLGGFVLMLGLAGVSYRSYRVKKRDNGIITTQKEVVEKKNHEILESITYAKKLQTAVLPPAKVVKEFFKNSFLLYMPRDIVSGDFYWMENLPNSPSLGGGQGEVSYFAVADCTGHGVPGAMLSVIGLNGLNRALNEQKLTEPKDILTSLSETVNRHFEGSDTTVRDGMDICLCALNTKTNVLSFAGANNPVWIVRNGEMIILKGDRRAIGHDDLNREFTQQEIQLEDGDTIYLASDGYQDQLGGEKYTKFMTRTFRSLLLRINADAMDVQRTTLITELENWRGATPQTDDICVMCIRV